MGVVDFTALTKPTAAELDIVARQGVMRFTDTSDRDTQLSGILEEGMYCFTAGDDSTWRYDGSAWVPIFTPWTAYTPTWTNLTVVDGTVDAKYRYVGGDLRVRGLFTFGSSDTVGGNIQQDIPDSETSDGTGASGIGVAADAGGERVPLVLDVLPSTNEFLFYHPDGATNNGVVNATAPFTWASGDKLRWDLWIPVA